LDAGGCSDKRRSIGKKWEKGNSGSRGTKSLSTTQNEKEGGGVKRYRVRREAVQTQSGTEGKRRSWVKKKTWPSKMAKSGTEKKNIGATERR